MKVKICGVRSVEVALAASRAGADFLGFNFAPVSKRRVELGVARDAIAAACTNGSTRAAGIFVNQPLDVVVRIAREAPLAYVQLSGDEDAAYCRAVTGETGVPVIKAVRLTQDDSGARSFAGAAEIFLADAAGSYGGAGHPWRWSDAADLAATHTVLLAGGLTPENVQEAAGEARPWGVDVASGVETNGQTDPEKVRAFIKQVRAYEHSHPAK